VSRPSRLILPARLASPRDAYIGGGAFLPQMFDQSECDKIIKDVEEHDKYIPSGHSGGKIDDYRRSQVYWMTDRDKWRWVYERVHRKIVTFNQSTWGFDLRMEETMQFVRYDHNQKGHYDWHTDLMGSKRMDRKLSLSVQLSNPSDYEGGGLLLWPEVRVPRNQGCCVVFPSYILHKVTPVESGTRYSLVGWVQGPPFR